MSDKQDKPNPPAPNEKQGERKPWLKHGVVDIKLNSSNKGKEIRLKSEFSNMDLIITFLSSRRLFPVKQAIW
jgi:hypothetical protein